MNHMLTQLAFDIMILSGELLQMKTRSSTVLLGIAHNNSLALPVSVPAPGNKTQGIDLWLWQD